MYKRILSFGTLVLTFAALFMSCEKETTDMQIPQRPEVVSSESKLRDSVYYYTHYFYLWQDKLPAAFPTSQYKTADLVLEELKTYARDPQGQVLDRFSFLDRSGSVNREIQQGQLGNFGFDMRYLNDHDLYIKRVYPGSPAHSAGLRRGWKILEVNGVTDLSVDEMEKDGFEFLFGALNAGVINLKLQNPAGAAVVVQLQSGSYSFDPVLATTVLPAGGDKIGYLAFDSFISPSLVQSSLTTIFGQFQTENVKSVIVDLRYNGGGDVATANYISNMLVPSSANSQLMNKYLINATLTMEGWGFFMFYPEVFEKTNSLEVDKVYFLVTNSTASASELLINNLKPYMDVVLIGDSRTFGKPVGYFGWDIMGVDLYAVSFQTFNAQNEGSYFDGMAPNVLTLDDVSRNFGDPQESMIAQALHHHQHGIFQPGSISMGRPDIPFRRYSKYQSGNQILESRSNKSMFDFTKTKLPESVLIK